MDKKRFQMSRRIDVVSDIYDSQNDKLLILSDVVDLLNEQQATISALKEENEQLQQQLAICQQSNDDGRFKVWEVPPIPKGTRITFSTTERSGKNE